ncbi:MAG: energy transducer TonB [Hyphomonadaceae bacterium]
MHFAKHLLISLTLCAPFGPAAFADISNTTIEAYNTAIAQTDRAAIIDASKALAAEAVATPEHPDSVLLAYETGAKLCEFGACASALDAANFVAAAPITDPEAHPLAEDRTLLASFANWSADSNRKNRKALENTLTEIVPTQPSNLSILAFATLYTSELNAGKTRNGAKIAGDAGDHLRPFAELVPRHFVSAEFVAAISHFNANQDSDAQLRMTHLQGWLGQYGTKLGETAPDWVADEQARASAWGLAMGAWYTSSRTRGSTKRGISPERLNAILESYTPKNVDTDPETTALDLDESEGRLPFCEGELKQSPKLRYRAGDGQRGFFGAVIAGFDIEDGRVVNLVVKAAVPEDRFEENALRTVSQWMWEPSENQSPGENCSMSRTNLALPLVFQLE